VCVCRSERVWVREQLREVKRKRRERNKTTRVSKRRVDAG
jgi:hypothetical protein